MTSLANRSGGGLGKKTLVGFIGVKVLQIGQVLDIGILFGAHLSEVRGAAQGSPARVGGWLALLSCSTKAHSRRLEISL